MWYANGILEFVLTYAVTLYNYAHIPHFGLLHNYYFTR